MCEFEEECEQSDGFCQQYADPIHQKPDCFKKPKQSQETPQADVALNDLLNAELTKAKELIMDWHIWYGKNVGPMPDGGMKMDTASVDILRRWSEDKVGI